MVDIRAKGANGERQVATALNEIIFICMHAMGLPMPTKPVVQRNQNQSAVGGGDLTGTFGMSIEIKCQEALSIGTWWKQCVASAQRNGDMPVLIYKQKNKGWKVVLLTQPWLPLSAPAVWVTSQISWEDFLAYFRVWVQAKLDAGEIPRT